MEHREDIGKLIQNKLNKAQKSPSDELWKKIDTTLEKERKKRAFFLWFSIGSLALLMILLYLFLGGFIIDTDSQPITIDTNQIENNNSKKESNKTNNSLLKTKDSIHEIKSKNTLTEDSNQNNNIVSNNKESKDSTVPITQYSKKSNNRITNTNPNSLNNGAGRDSINNSNTYFYTDKHSSKINKQNLKKDKALAVISNNNNNNNNNNTSSISSSNDRSLKNNENPNTYGATQINNDSLTKSEKLLIERQKRKDSISKIRERKKDSITKLRKNKEETLDEKEANKKDSILDQNNEKIKINVTLIGAPQYSSPTNSGSLINGQLDSFDTKGAFNFNYGASLNFVGTRYMYSIGILKTRISYQTMNAIVLDPSLDTINGENVLIYPENILNYSTLTINSQVDFSTLNLFKNSDSTINLTHTIDYIEVPLQFTYFLTQKKFGLQVFGGLSGYFLTDNTIVAENELGEKLAIGSSNNLSKISLSANAGFGVYYNISKMFTIELNPTFKYLYRPTTTPSIKSSILLFGIYTGIRINLTPNRD